MHSLSPLQPCRRRWLRDAGLGIGSLALTSLLHTEKSRARAAGRFDLRAKAPHFSPRAKSVILLMQNGAPSQMDLFDPKPELARQHGKKIPVFDKNGIILDTGSLMVKSDGIPCHDHTDSSARWHCRHGWGWAGHYG